MKLWADAERAHCLKVGQASASETVFSHTSKLDLFAAVQRTGAVMGLSVVSEVIGPPAPQIAPKSPKKYLFEINHLLIRPGVVLTPSSACGRGRG